MEFDDVDLTVGPGYRCLGAALHFLSLQVRGHVVVREEHGLQLARSRLVWICEIETEQFFSLQNLSDLNTVLRLVRRHD